MIDEYLGGLIAIQTIGIGYLIWHHRRLEKLTEIVGDGLWLFFQQEEGPCDDLECEDCFPRDNSGTDYKQWDGAE